MCVKYVDVAEIAEIVTLTHVKKWFTTELIVNYLKCDYDNTKYRWKAAC